MKLVALDSPLWEAYRGAYGSVREEVGILMGEPAGPQVQLRRLKEEAVDGEHLAFDNLCESLSHQMTFYDGLYLALPYLVKFLGMKAGDYDWQRLILTEAGLCLATDVPWEGDPEPAVPPEILESYREAAQLLAQQAEVFLNARRKELRKEGVFERRQLCAGLYGLLGDRREAFAMAMNGWQTCYVQCGRCGFLDEDLELNDTKQRRKLRPLRFWQKKPPACRRFRKVLHDMGDWEGEEFLADYYGAYVCPQCGARQPVMEAMIRAFDPAFEAPEKTPAPEQKETSGKKTPFPKVAFRPKEAAPKPGAGKNTASPPEAPPKAAKAPAAPPKAEEAQEAPAPKKEKKPWDDEPPGILEDNAISRAPDLCREDYPSVLDLAVRGEFREAAEWCARYLDRVPDWRLHAFRAFCYKALKKTPELDRCLTAALELDPDNVLILRARCPTVSTTNRYRRHIQDLTRLIELDPENRSSYLLSRAYRRHWTGDGDGAREDLRAALAAEPGIWHRSVDFRYLWGEFGLPEEEARDCQP